MSLTDKSALSTIVFRVITWNNAELCYVLTVEPVELKTTKDTTLFMEMPIAI